jgi:predicted nucleic acid-binding protein
VRFWDTSAIIPLILGEPTTEAAFAMLEHDPQLVVWWATGVECLSAIARREREGFLDPQAVGVASERLAGLAASWEEVQPAERVRRTATRLLRVHPLRAADALQLAAAIIAAEDHPRSLPFVSLDDRLALAAQREGFPVVVPGA